jgi:hypothetical protein
MDAKCDLCDISCWSSPEYSEYTHRDRDVCMSRRHVVPVRTRRATFQGLPHVYRVAQRLLAYGLVFFEIIESEWVWHFSPGVSATIWLE